jgi:hypothetical protein
MIGWLICEVSRANKKSLHIQIQFQQLHFKYITEGDEGPNENACYTLLLVIRLKFNCKSPLKKDDMPEKENVI